MLGQRANSIIDTLQQIASGGQSGIQPQQSPTSLLPAPANRMGQVLESAAIGNPFRNQGQPAGSIVPAMERENVQEMYSSPAQVGSALAKPTMPPEVEEKAVVADAIVRKAAADPEAAAADPTFGEKVKGYFGSEENMLRLAMAFNTMRMQPDQQLGAYLGARLGKIQESKVSAAGAKDIASQLLKMGYPDYAKQVLANPNMAKDIYNQIIQKELKPEAADSISGVQYDRDNRAYIVRTPKNGGDPTVQYLGTTRISPTEAAAVETEAMKLQEQWKLSIKRSDEAMDKASNVGSMLNDYQAALKAIQNGAESGIIRSRLPAFDAQTALLQNAASRLGIGVINSATFGALSQSELDLALKQSIDLSLSTTPDPITGISPLEEQIIAKMKATEKLYSALVDQAAEMASMPYGEYTQLIKERKAENAKYIKKPDGVDDAKWYSMTLDQKKRFYEAGDQ